VWVLGGFDARGAAVRTVEVYDPASDSWRRGPDLPVPLHHANVAVTEGKLYVVGFLVSSFVASGRAFMHDPAEDGWRELASMPDGTQRGAASVAVLGGEIFVAGGFRDRAVADFSAYDPASDSWRTLPPLPRRADHVVAGAIDGLLYVAGGRSGGIEGHSASLLAFDPERMTWTDRAPMPTSRGGGASAVVNGRLYVFGGEGNAADPSGIFGQVESYDPVTDDWTSLPSMPVRRHGTGAATIGGVIYIPGGASEQGFGAVDTNSAFTPPG
jgi:N-acetylneuraminic acid mutarotase